VKQRDVSEVPFRYIKIHLTASQCCFPELLMYMLTTHTTCAMLDLVHTMAYIRLPVTEV